MRDLPQRRRRSAVTIVLVAAIGLLAAGGCAPKRVLRVPDAATGPPADDTGPVPPAADAAETAVRLALAQRGRPYAYGGMTPDRGFDCSGLVLWAYGEAGVALPRVVSEQATRGRTVPPDALARGDLLFFATGGGSRISHVGIYVGGDRFVHAPRTGDVVKTDSLDDAWWRRRWVDSRRVAGPP